MVYDEYGDKRKPTILLLHGAGVLDTFAKQYDELSKQYHLLVPHLPGAGKAASFAYVPDATDHDLLELISSLPNKPIGVIGHSLGAQIAVRLVSKMPAYFQFAIFLSAWVVPDPLMSKVYCSLAPFCAALLHFKWLVAMQGQYWNFSQKQIETMSQYSKQISASVYRSFFAHTLDLSHLPEYQNVSISMLAICGSQEIKAMKVSLVVLSENPHCKTILLSKASHDFPMRNAQELNLILTRFIKKALS